MLRQPWRLKYKNLKSLEGILWGREKSDQILRSLGLYSQFRHSLTASSQRGSSILYFEKWYDATYWCPAPIHIDIFKKRLWRTFYGPTATPAGSRDRATSHISRFQCQKTLTISAAHIRLLIPGDLVRHTSSSSFQWDSHLINLERILPICCFLAGGPRHL